MDVGYDGEILVGPNFLRCVFEICNFSDVKDRLRRRNHFSTQVFAQGFGLGIHFK